MAYPSFLGSVNKEQYIKYLLEKIDYALTADPYISHNVFHKAFGIQGMNVTALDENMPSCQGVIISYRDLIRLLAQVEIMIFDEDQVGIDPRYRDREAYALRIKTKEMHIRYLRATGMSDETIEDFEELSKDLRK